MSWEKTLDGLEKLESEGYLPPLGSIIRLLIWRVLRSVLSLPLTHHIKVAKALKNIGSLFPVGKLKC